MTVIVELRPEIEAGLAVLAAEQGVTLTHYIRRLLEQQIQVDQAERSPAERAAAWRKSATGLPHTPPLPDDASSREILYSARG